MVDAMATLQTTKPTTNMSYSELASSIFSSITRGAPADGRIDWVIDTYPDVSIKNAERDHRSVAGTLETKIRSGA